VAHVITVESKLKSFSENIIKRVQEDSEKRLREFSIKNNELLEKEKEQVLKEAEAIIERMKTKAQSEKQQIISKAYIEKEYAILQKKKEIFQRVIKDIKNMAEEFTLRPEYVDFLESCIDNGLSQIKGKEANIFFKPQDIERYRENICSFINKKYDSIINTHILPTDEDIIGGCIVQNSENTIRIDCSITSLIIDNQEFIGRTLMDGLQ